MELTGRSRVESATTARGPHNPAGQARYDAIVQCVHPGKQLTVGSQPPVERLY